MNYPSKRDDCKMFEKNNPTTALNILYTKEKEILPTYISKHYSIREKQIILLMIPNKEKERRNYLAVKKSFSLLRGITSNHHGDLHCLNSFIPLEQKNRLKSHEKLCKTKDFCGTVKPSEKDKML